jgi:two-component system chemotaxis response regulator CheB
MSSTAQGRENASGTIPPIVALAASAGGIGALRQILAALPAAFPAAVVIVQHMAPHQPSVMANILGRHSILPVAEAREGTQLTPGKIYVAPPNRHLLVGPQGILALSDASRVHFVRPAADLLFTSLAESRGAGAIAVVLTGSGFDGADGVVAIKRHGGTVIVQDKATSEFSGMPMAALATGCADRVLPLEEIAPALIELLRREEDT